MNPKDLIMMAFWLVSELGTLSRLERREKIGRRGSVDESSLSPRSRLTHAAKIKNTQVFQSVRASMNWSFCCGGTNGRKGRKSVGAGFRRLHFYARSKMYLPVLVLDTGVVASDPLDGDDLFLVGKEAGVHGRVGEAEEVPGRRERRKTAVSRGKGDRGRSRVGGPGLNLPDGDDEGDATCHQHEDPPRRHRGLGVEDGEGEESRDDLSSSIHQEPERDSSGSLGVGVELDQRERRKEEGTVRNGTLCEPVPFLRRLSTHHRS